MNVTGKLPGGFLAAELDDAPNPARLAPLVQLDMDRSGQPRWAGELANRVVDRNQATLFLAGEPRENHGRLLDTVTVGARIQPLPCRTYQSSGICSASLSGIAW
jgi:hypothetical protein